MKEIFICIITTFLISCKEKEQMVIVPEHIGGSLYAKKKIPKSEYEKMLKEKEIEKEMEKRKGHKNLMEMENFYKKQKEEWNENFKNPKKEIIECEPNIKINPQTETKTEKKPIYEAKGIKIYESK